MFDLSPEKIVLLGIIALVVLGPNRLPQAARHLGHFVSQMRRMTSSFQSEMRDALGEPIDAFTSAANDLNPRSVPAAIRRAIDPTIPPAPRSRVPEVTAPAPATPGGPGGDYTVVGQLSAPDDPSLN